MKSIKDLFKRYYTKELTSNTDKTVYDLFKWKKTDVFFKDHKSSKVLVDMKDVEFPEQYSQTACDIIASKYFRKAGVPSESGCENSMKAVAHRMVNFWCEALKNEGIIKTEEEASIFYDESVYALLNQMYAPNSPQWFNTGLAHSYDIKGSNQGLYYFDENKEKVIKSPDNYTRTQASACFILSIEDQLLGPHSISEQYVTETKLFKGGSGTGTNFSSIRAKDEKLSGGGFSSGLMSFLKGLDRNAGAIKSGGTTRRAAKMVCLDVDHPEIMDFITWKAKEENKVRALGKMGYDMDIDGEAYETVSGQNSNNSVRFSDYFMNKVDNLNNKPEETIKLEGRVDSKLDKIINVSDIWEAFNSSAWQCADPAPQFSDTFNAWHTCPAGEDGILNAPYNKINSTNPCGEYAFLDDSSCNLASINIYRFYNNIEHKFDIDGYLHVIGLVQLILEASIHWGQYPTEDIARKSYLFRPTGLGVSNIASLFMVIGYPYDSDEARNLAASLIGILTGYSYYISSLMAKEVGTFKKFEINKPYMMKVIRNHARTAGVNPDTVLKDNSTKYGNNFEGLNYTPLKVNHDTLNKENFKYISLCLKDCFSKALIYGENYGYRNAQVSVIAPTGTISFAMDCSATSIEPFFSHIVYKKLSGGGFLTMINPVITTALKNLGYSSDEIEDILAYVLEKETVTENGFTYEKVLDGKIEGAPHLKEEHLPIFDTSNRCGSGERYISPMGHVLMVASITPLISGAVSKTVNLPKTASIEDFKNIVLSSWKLGVKGIALYRDSSKAAQPLNTSLADNTDSKLENLTYKQLLQKAKDLQKGIKPSKRDKPVGIRCGTTHPAQIDDVKIYTTVNRRENGEISEIYITTDREGTIIMGLLNSLSKAVSVMLQYHVPPQDIARMLRGQKYEPYGFVQKHPYIKHVSSISDLISKVIDIELGDFSRCQVKPENYDENTLNTNNKSTISSPNILENKFKLKKVDGERLYGVTCPNCASTRMVRNGTCMVCLDCGSTTGCS
ncbi:vitamin B12-dependent ribonucleotide reductase [Clostridium sp. P21]|uniref:Vitamin B12-dependent ribonucleotide reductase n=1 Tax=Clostridium muellerianum TaxID=2716538 RepID=A0A7Y0EG79_9CLOT|nr:vitamin B12-dependent ribonucleotide reductase [Clostridium muellerianum]NMM62885.1 vitamin B12-dependent ribonucleotide reductase [Clostridium muellerianum]